MNKATALWLGIMAVIAVVMLVVKFKRSKTDDS